MEALGLPAPQTLYGSLTAALATAVTIDAYITKFGAKVTLREHPWCWRSAALRSQLAGSFQVESRLAKHLKLCLERALPRLTSAQRLSVIRVFTTQTGLLGDISLLQRWLGERPMKDDIALLLVALACAGLAWAFWRYLGQNAFAVLIAIFFVALWFDNRRLRKKLRQLDGGK